MRNLTKEDLRHLLDKKIFHQISEVADEQGVECYVVGGYVRDLFLERPSQDIDVVTVGMYSPSLTIVAYAPAISSVDTP